MFIKVSFCISSSARLQLMVMSNWRVQQALLLEHTAKMCSFLVFVGISVFVRNYPLTYSKFIRLHKLQ
jgi:hypothetical protein